VRGNDEDQVACAALLANIDPRSSAAAGHLSAADLAQFLPDVWKRDGAAEPQPAQ
jgi:hypothetical protein